MPIQIMRGEGEGQLSSYVWERASLELVTVLEPNRVKMVDIPHRPRKQPKLYESAIPSPILPPR